MTFLFTDVEGSTRLWEQDADAMREALVSHDAKVRSAIEAHQGYIFSTTGDGFCAAFWEAGQAVDAAATVQAALAAQPWPEGLNVRVRIGMHTGTAAERDGDYFGPTVNRAARVMAVGHGGQGLLSDATAKLAGRDDIQDLGEHRLKDLPGLERIWQLGNHVFPALRSGRRPAGNLPTSGRSLVGRVEERERLCKEVRPGQLVTLTGVGGVGKTRLALDVAQRLIGDFPDGVWWFDLTPLDDPAGVVPAVSSVLAVTMHADASAIEAVVDSVRGRRSLLVFDNCEHLLDAAADLVDAVISAGATVAALATSREPLAIAGERVWPLRPLDPDTEGVELFVERAKAADATFIAGDRPLLVELCRRLDGIPLAIELAAGRIRTMGPSEVLSRLDDRFRLLRGGPRRGVDRHRTLATTLDWSYSLLDAHEQALFDRLAVFAGAFDGADVENLCADHIVDALDVGDLLASLVEKSLVVTERNPSSTRYRLLETVRHYAETHAVEEGILGALRDRHLRYYVNVAESAFADLLNDYSAGRAVFDRAWDNLRAATQHAFACGDSDSLDRMFGAIGFHAAYGLHYEVLDWATHAGRLPGAGAATFGAGAFLAGMLGRFEDAERLARQGISAAPSPLEPPTWLCWTALYVALVRGGESESALEAASAAHRTSALAAGGFGDALWSAMRAYSEVRSDPAGASEHARRAEALTAGARNPAMLADVLARLGRYYGLTGDTARGIDYCRQALALAQDHDIPFSRNNARAMLARLASSGGVDDATPAFREAIEGAYQDRYWVFLWPTVRALGRWWATHDEPEPAATITGYLDAHGLGTLDPTTSAALDTHPDTARWLAQGARLDRDQLVVYILNQLRTPTRS